MCCSNYRILFKCGVLKVQNDLRIETNCLLKFKWRKVNVIYDGKEQVMHTYYSHTEITGIKNPNTLCENFMTNLCVGGEITYEKK